MKTLLSTILAVTLGALCLVAQDAAKKTDIAQVSGKWTVSMDTPHGKMQGPMQVTQEGAKITGTFEIEHMGTLNFSGKVEGSKVSFTMEIPEAQTSLVFTGSVAGDKMSGTAAPQDLAWSATR